MMKLFYRKLLSRSVNRHTRAIRAHHARDLLLPSRYAIRSGPLISVDTSIVYASCNRYRTNRSRCPISMFINLVNIRVVHRPVDTLHGNHRPVDYGFVSYRRIDHCHDDSCSVHKSKSMHPVLPVTAGKIGRGWAKTCPSLRQELRGGSNPAGYSF
jgi:hypothetical protein